VASASLCAGQFDCEIGCRSLKIHRVKSALLMESAFGRTVPSAAIDCVNKLQLMRA
jgi:hypothetical protein